MGYFSNIQFDILKKGYYVLCRAVRDLTVVAVMAILLAVGGIKFYYY